MNNDMNVYGTNGIEVSNYDDNVFRVSLTEDVYEKICETNVGYGEFSETCDELYDHLKYHREKLMELEKENKELRKLIARLNTRVNNIVAEKQKKDFYEKNYTAKYVD